MEDPSKIKLVRDIFMWQKDINKDINELL
jgi:hypothetical protein